MALSQCNSFGIIVFDRRRRLSRLHAFRTRDPQELESFGQLRNKLPHLEAAPYLICGQSEMPALCQDLTNGSAKSHTTGKYSPLVSLSIAAAIRLFHRW